MTLLAILAQTASPLQWKNCHMGVHAWPGDKGYKIIESDNTLLAMFAIVWV